MLQRQLEEQEDKSNKMYLHMYTKGQEAERVQTREKVSGFFRGISLFESLLFLLGTRNGAQSP